MADGKLRRRDVLAEEMLLDFLNEHSNARSGDIENFFGFPSGMINLLLGDTPPFNISIFGRALGRMVEDGRVLCWRDEDSIYHYRLTEKGNV